MIRTLDITEIFGDSEISYYLEHQFNGFSFNNSEIDFSDIEDFIKTRAVSRELAGMVNRYANALVAGDYDYYLTTDEILDISKNIEPELNKLFNHQMTEDEHEQLAGRLSDIMGFEGISVYEIIFGTTIERVAPYLAISPYLLLVAGLLCIITLCVILLLNSNKITDAFPYIGVPIILSGFAFNTVCMIFGFFPELFDHTVYQLSRFAFGFVGLYSIELAWALAEGFVSLVMWHGVALIAIGTLLTLASLNQTHQLLKSLFTKKRDASPSS